MAMATPWSGSRPSCPSISWRRRAECSAGATATCGRSRCSTGLSSSPRRRPARRACSGGPTPAMPR
eukprot:7137515-Pyramimonas_sp.AAC.1